eukprot:TRINITY_DN1694_c0_g1_i1.p1 TRINITY_DN1694_c0_g1~~TRINITY_DN1694_c0_g1_i1.p1  ORF type:complete len:571 (-),score=180.10 TRINITY_DN1694_c0_g1_i1:85-1698(-)
MVTDYQLVQKLKEKMLAEKVPRYAKHATVSLQEVELKITEVRMKLTPSKSGDRRQSTGIQGLFAFDLTRRTVFTQSVHDLRSHLTKIVTHRHKLDTLAKQQEQPAVIHKVYYELAQSFQGNPCIQINWLSTLATMQAEVACHGEAAMCYSMIALIIATNIRLALPQGLDLSALESICSYHAPPPTEALEGRDFLSEKSLLDNLRHAIDNFSKAELYELASVLYTLMVQLLQGRSLHKELSDVHVKLAELHNTIASKVETGRLLDQYWRVTLCGPNIGDNLGEFIYKEKITENLYTLCQRFQRILGKDAIQLDATKTPDPTKLEFQVTVAKPYWDPAVEKTRSFFHKGLITDSFMVEVPYTPGGKAHAVVAGKQWKKKIILHTEHQFPWVLTRQRIISKMEICLSPIEFAIETLVWRSQELAKEVAKVRDTAKAPASPETPVNLSSLQGVLQGSVLLQVNGGISELIQGFPPGGDYAPEHVAKLCSELQDFLHVCSEALEVNREYIRPNQVPFHTELENGYRALETLVVDYVNKLKVI